MQERNQVGLSLKNGESLRISVCHVSGWARGRVNNSFVSGQTQSGLSRPWALSIRSGVCLPCGPALHISLYAPQGRGNHSHAPKYAFLNCVLLPYRIGRSGVGWYQSCRYEG